MMNGYYGLLLDVNLTNREIRKLEIPQNDLKLFLGGRGLAMKILWDRLNRPGVDALSPENLLMFMPGPFSGLPIPSSSRTTVVCKSPRTSALNSPYKGASTISYSSMGGFFGPEIRFAGYDGLVIHGKADRPVYLFIDDDKVEIRDASNFWGMKTDEFDVKFIDHLGDRRFRTCYIGPAGEALNPMACILNTAARAAGRGGTGCVMGSKNLKAIAVRGTGMPNVADHEGFLNLLEKARQAFGQDTDSRKWWRAGGTTNALESASSGGVQAVKNYQEGTFEDIHKIGTQASREQIWKRDFACFCCQLSCKKSGNAKGAYGGLIHDGPEYETGTMLGANLLISDLAGLQKAIFIADDYGIDIISAGNAIGFLMEAYEGKLIDRYFLEDIDLTWGNVDATIQMLHLMGQMQGIGKEASRGVKYLADKIGQESEKFAIHVKGHELAAWNVHAAPGWFGVSYATCNRGACHMHGGSPKAQDELAIRDSLGACNFADDWYKEDISYHHFLKAITGLEWNEAELRKAGERIINLERIFNHREGFTRADDQIPERFYLDAPTIGPAKGMKVGKDQFRSIMDEYYHNRQWCPVEASPSVSKINELNLGFTLISFFKP
jgi:aldehyde:ferredoxin oxidoreductase